MAQLLAKFRIDFSDVIIIPDVTKKADPATKAEFEELISGCDIDTGELNSEREKTNRYACVHLRMCAQMHVRIHFASRPQALHHDCTESVLASYTQNV